MVKATYMSWLHEKDNRSVGVSFTRYWGFGKHRSHVLEIAMWFGVIRVWT